MERGETDERSFDPGDETELARGLIVRKQRGEQVDGDILILLDDLERVGLTETEAYRVLYPHRPQSES